jgi:NADH-quinone oxidoreductase subunit M
MSQGTAAFLLLASVLMPAAGAVLAVGDRVRARQSALVTALITLLLAAVLVAGYPGGVQDYDNYGRIDRAWLAGPGSPVDVRFSLALDGLSLWLYALTALLTVVAVLISWETIDEQAGAFYRLLLLLETGMLGVFAARDIILFYVFFEFTLIPLYFLIGIWGSEQRRYAAIKFFLFTLAGSVLTFLGLLAIVLWVHRQSGVLTFSIPALTNYLSGPPGAVPMPPAIQLWIFAALAAGFAIKVPLFPLHTWLPLAHVQAPAAGSVILAGVLLKVGSYGFVRFNVAMLPEATAALMPWLLAVSVAGILYGALVALAQSDMKRLIAYSSVSHLGFCMLGVFALNRLGTQGGVLQMINHGLSTGALFALVGMLYERYHTRQIADLGGLARRTPVLAFFMVLMTLSSIGLPGLNGFAGEFLLLVGMFQRGWTDAPPAWALHYRVIAVLATSGVVLGAWYMLWLVQRVFFGPLREPEHAPGQRPVRDLNRREVLALVPVAAMVVWIGVQPGFFLDRMAPTLDRLTARAMQAAEEGSGVRGQGSGVRGHESEVRTNVLLSFLNPEPRTLNPSPEPRTLGLSPEPRTPNAPVAPLVPRSSPPVED